MITQILTTIDNNNSKENDIRKQKVTNEKRKRYQIYKNLDYTIPKISYFDFFSHDAFEYTKQAKLFAEILEQNQTTSDFLLFVCVENESPIAKILTEAGITKREINTVLSKEYNIPKVDFASNTLGRIPLISTFIFGVFNRKKYNLNIPYSHELNIIFEKASENALSRFKTPVITPEILFITMMEERESRVAKVIKNICKNPLQWYLIRYKLLKRLHYHEVNIRSEVKKSDHLFAYLLKTQLSELHFDRLIESDFLQLGVLFFRYIVIKNQLSIDMNTLIEKDIHKSLKVTNNRQYTS